MALRNSHDDGRYRSGAYDNGGSNHPSRPRASTVESQPPLHHPQPRSQPVQDTTTPSLDPPNIMSPPPQVSPELVAQITQQVLNSLSLNGIAASVPTTAAPPPPSAFHAPTENSQAVPPRDVYTPPSPDRYSGPDTGSIPPSLEDYQLDGHSEKPEKRTHTVRFAERPATPPLTNNAEPQRPKPAPRASTGDATTLEKIWQPLFDTDGQPTARLGQFLRGLAMHIIEDFEPQHSLVIAPAKMVKFYNMVKLPNEVYPWHSIFGGQITLSSLSHLYRDLKCEHHFCQSDLDQKPSIPCLTPRGFETWMTLAIRSRPDLEYKRFSEAVLNLPINNADNVKERFPKELSRRLFPKEADSQIQMDFEDAIYADPDIEIPPPKPADTKPAQASQSSMPPPQNQHQPPPSPKFKVPNPVNISAEGPRKAPSKDFSDIGSDEGIPPISIERERKPYRAQAGGGKLFDGADSRSEEPLKRANSVGHHHRTETREHRDSFADSGGPSHTRSSAQTTAGAPPMAQRRRQRSPSTSAQGNSYSKPDDYSAYSAAPGASTDDEEERRGYKVKYSTEGSDARGSTGDASRGGYPDDRYARSRRGSVQPGSTSQRY